MRPVYSALLASLALATSMLIHGQAPGTTKSASPDSSAETPMFSVYQAIFARQFLSGGPSLSSDDSNKKSVIAFFISIGLDEKAANALFPYVRDGLAQQEAYSKQKRVQLCKGRADIKSKAQFGDAYAALYDELDRMRKHLWGNFEFLSARNRGVLSAYAMQRSAEMEIYPTDARAIFEKSPETLDQLLERICKGN